MTPLEQQRKAIVAGLIAGIGAAGFAAAHMPFTVVDWLAIAGAALVAYQGVFWTPNDKAAPAEAEAAPDQLS